MKRHVWVAIFFLSVIDAGQALGGEPSCCEPTQPGFLQRLPPVGGWNPYGGGLLRWWPPHCFPCYGAPDDYCRKPLPRVCWPPYPSYYRWGLPPEGCCPQGNGCRDCNQPQSPGQGAGRNEK